MQIETLSTPAILHSTILYMLLLGGCAKMGAASKFTLDFATAARIPFPTRFVTNAMK
jgi:hypothetical protein